MFNDPGPDTLTGNVYVFGGVLIRVSFPKYALESHGPSSRPGTQAPKHSHSGTVARYQSPDQHAARRSRVRYIVLYH